MTLILQFDGPALLRIERHMASLRRQLKKLKHEFREEIRKMNDKLDTIGPKLDALTSIGDGMEALLGTLSAEIAALKNGDPEQDAKIDALNAKIEAKTSEWAAALANNTPATTGQPGADPIPAE